MKPKILKILIAEFDSKKEAKDAMKEQENWKERDFSIKKEKFIPFDSNEWKIVWVVYETLID